MCQRVNETYDATMYRQRFLSVENQLLVEQKAFLPTLEDHDPKRMALKNGSQLCQHVAEARDAMMYRRLFPSVGNQLLVESGNLEIKII